MDESNPTKFEHYVHYPVCGFCTTAWDVIFQRLRSITSPARWVEYCKWGGCDPDVWDYINEKSGWPYGWKLIAQPTVVHEPIRVRWDQLPEPPEYDDRVYHKRSPDSTGPAEPWRKVSAKLLRQAQERAERLKNGDFEIVWDDEEEDFDEASVYPVAEDQDTDDGDNWDDDDIEWV